MIGRFRFVCAAAALALTLSAGDARAHTRPPAAPPAPTEPARDALGRDTPRGTLLGFLNAGRKGDNDLARHYLDTPLPDGSAGDLAHQLFVVLDARLPPRLAQVSDAPDGSRANPLMPDVEHVGTIAGPNGQIEIAVERIRRPRSEPMWLFSTDTLAAVPDIYAEIMRQREAPWLPSFLVEQRIGHVRLFEWLALLLGLPAFYFVTVLLNRALTPAFAWLSRSLPPRLDGSVRHPIPTPVRLLLLTVAVRWLSSRLPLSLLVRQGLTSTATVGAMCASTWFAMLITEEVEGIIRRRVARTNNPSAMSLVHAGRRALDAVIVLIGALVILRHFGVDPTTLLAGLGVGGIAVALAAQKTLENVIAGASLIFDQAVRVGDFLRVGSIEGTVDHVGLRSTRIRTLDRSIVSVPNSQIANMSVETLSARDKFWFHPVVGLSYATTGGQMQVILDGVRQALEWHPSVDQTSIRVRFLRLGTYSLDIEVFAYVQAPDWGHFLEIQEGLLLRVTEIVSAAGSEIAFPTQTMHMSTVNSTTPQLPMPN